MLDRKEYDRLYRIKNKDKRKQHSKKYRLENSEIEKRRTSKWRLNNQDRIKQQQQVYRNNNKENQRISYNRRLRTPNGTIINAFFCHQRRIKKNISSDGTITKKSLKELLEKQNTMCKYCGVFLDFSIKRFVNLHHIIPLHKEGTHTIGNVERVCSVCHKNLHKHR